MIAGRKKTDKMDKPQESACDKFYGLLSPSLSVSLFRILWFGFHRRHRTSRLRGSSCVSVPDAGDQIISSTNRKSGRYNRDESHITKKAIPFPIKRGLFSFSFVSFFFLYLSNKSLGGSKKHFPKRLVMDVFYD